MLSEAYQVAKSLERAGIKPDATSGDVKFPGASSGIRAFVRLRADGSIAGVGNVEKDDEPGLWTIMEGNHNSFPVVRFKRPLVVLPAEHPIWPELAKASRLKESNRAIAKTLGDHVDPSAVEPPDPSLLMRLRRDKAPAVQARAATTAPDVAELCARFLLAVADTDAFFKELAMEVLEEIRRPNYDLVPFARELLVGKEPVKGKPEANVQLVLNLDRYPGIYWKNVRVAMSDSGGKAETETVSHCAYRGECKDPLDEPFPKLRVPVLGFDYPLLSMFSEAGCNVRYGLTDERIIPISAGEVRRAHSALSHLLEDANREIVWRPVKSGYLERKKGKTVEKTDLFVAFLGEGDAQVKPARGAGVPAGVSYRNETQSLVKALKGVAYHNHSARVTYFLLSAISKGQAQAVYAEQVSAEEAFKGAEAWADNQEKRPKTVVDNLNKEGSLVSPEGAVQALSYVWKQDGKDSHRKTGILFGQAFDLLLRRPGRADAVAEEVLRLVAARATPFLARMAVDQRTQEPSSPREIAQARNLLNLLALALEHLGTTQEQTMQSQAFLVGQLLALADRLHIDYCKDERNGQVPPSLMGSALLVTATESPQRALSTLAQRIAPYAQWAKTADRMKAGRVIAELGPKRKADQKARSADPTAKSSMTPEENKSLNIAYAVNDASKVLNEFEQISVKIGEEIADKCDDKMRAQMLIGYLTRGASEKTPTTISNEKEDEDAE